MILNKINYKNLATVNVSYNLIDIQETITSIEQQVNELKTNEEMDPEFRDFQLDDYQEQLEILKLIEGKLN